MSKFKRLRRYVASIGCALLVELCGGLSPLGALDAEKHDFAVRIWRSQDGLPQSRIQAITQTQDGYLWIGTSAGLVRFDGVRFVVFDRFNAPAFSDDSIISFLPARDGSLWIGSQGGGLLHYVDGDFEAFGTDDGLTDLFIRKIFEDSRGAIWIGTDRGLFRYESGEFERLDRESPTKNLFVSSIYEDQQQRIWAGGTQLVRVEGDSLVGYPIEGEGTQRYVNTILRLEDGSDPYLLTWQGLQTLRGRRLWDEPITGLSGPPKIRTVLEDQSGDLWLGAIANGLIRISGENTYTYSGPEWLPDNSVLSLYEDRQGNLWVGTIDGLARLSPNLLGTVTAADGLDDDNVVAVSEDRSGHRWLATGSGGLYRLAEGGKPVRYPLPLSTEEFAARSVFEDSKGVHWIGSGQSGLMRIDDDGVRIFNPSNGLAHHSVRAFAEDRDGNIWIATGSGLSRWDGSEIQNYHVDDGLAYRSVRSLLLDSSGDLWVGTDLGVNRVRNGKFMADPILDRIGRERIYTIREDSSGGIWLGTRGGGLCRVKDDDMVCLSTRQGLVSNTVFQLLQDEDDRFWMSSPSGIFSIDGGNLRGVADGTIASLSAAAYGSAEGLNSTQMSGGFQPAGDIFSDGKIWFPSVKGAVTIDPDRVPVTDVAPVLIEEVLIDEEPVRTNGEIRVPASGHRLEIHYTVPNLMSSARIGFRYKLEGFDSTWTAVSPRRVAQYVGLPPGDYRFRVAAVDTFFPEREAETAIAVAWVAPFYRTSWFTALGILLCGAMAWAGFRQYENRTRQRYAVRLAERARVAREMHDTVIQECAGVSALLEAASSAMNTEKSSARELLDHARKQIGLTLDEARRAVWDLRHDPSDQPPMLSLVDFAINLSREKQIPIELDISESSYKLEGELARNLLLIGQEALRNAVTHGKPDRVRVRLEIDEENALLEITDDGRGFDPDSTDSETTLHYGLLGMKERVEQFGGRLEIISGLGEGATVLAQLPLAGRRPTAEGLPS